MQSSDWDRPAHSTPPVVVTTEGKGAGGILLGQTTQPQAMQWESACYNRSQLECTPLRLVGERRKLGPAPPDLADSALSSLQAHTVPMPTHACPQTGRTPASQLGHTHVRSARCNARKVPQLAAWAQMPAHASNELTAQWPHAPCMILHAAPSALCKALDSVTALAAMARLRCGPVKAKSCRARRMAPHEMMSLRA